MNDKLDAEIFSGELPDAGLHHDRQISQAGDDALEIGRLSQLSPGEPDREVDVEGAEGRSISDIFVDSGEAHFRELEAAAVGDALANHDGVLALGGGAVLDPATRELLAGHTVVFLRVGLSDAVKRVGLGTARPLLLGNMRARIKALLDERTPIYESVATLSVDTDGRSAEDVAAQIVGALR